MIALNALNNLIKKSRQEVLRRTRLEAVLALLQSKADGPQVRATDAMNTAI